MNEPFDSDHRADQAMSCDRTKRKPRVRIGAPEVIMFVAALLAATPLTWLLYRSLPTLPISKAEAIRRAEEFVIRNGYTDLPADPNRKLTPDPVLGMNPNREEELKYRHDTLERKADGIYGDGWNGWMVYFRYKHHPEWDFRRAVGMKGNGKGIYMIHEDVY